MSESGPTVPRAQDPTTASPSISGRERAQAAIGSRIWSSRAASAVQAIQPSSPCLICYLRQLAADEDDAAVALLAVLPGTLVVAVEDHVHALEHEAIGIVLERQDALAAQDAWPLRLHEVLHPGKELVRIERRVDLERHRLHLLVVIVLQAATVMMAVLMVVMVIMTVSVIMTVVVIVVVAVVEKFGLDLQDAVEVEGIAPQNLRQRDLAALGLCRRA